MYADESPSSSTLELARKRDSRPQTPNFRIISAGPVDHFGTFSNERFKMSLQFRRDTGLQSRLQHHLIDYQRLLMDDLSIVALVSSSYIDRFCLRW
jgi:hypothetical protein